MSIFAMRVEENGDRRKFVDGWRCAGHGGDLSGVGHPAIADCRC